MDIFFRHHVRGSVRIGCYLIALKPSIWISAVHGVIARLASRAGLHLSWLKDRKAPYSIAMPWTKEDKSYTVKNTPSQSIIIADYIFQNDIFEDLRGKSRVTATIMHDLFYRRAEMVVETGVKDSVISVEKHDEIRMLKKSDMVIAIQQADADFVAKNIPETKVMTVPISFSTVKEPQVGNSGEILFVGSNTEPNVSGLKWFFENCWSEIIGTVPRATLSIAGSVNIGLANFPIPRSVRYLGIVDDLTPLYSRSGIIISPLTFGSGLKIKLIEAMAFGKAIVATSVTLQGVEEISESAVCKADDAGDFAAAVVSLIKDKSLRAKKGNAAIVIAAEHFSTSAAQGLFIEWLAQHSGPATSPHDNKAAFQDLVAQNLASR